MNLLNLPPESNLELTGFRSWSNWTHEFKPSIERKLWENPVLKIPEYTVALSLVILAAFHDVSLGTD